MVFQYLVAIIGLIAIFQNYTNYKRGKQAIRTVVFWTLAWISVILVAIIPEVTTFLSSFLNIERPIDAILYPSIVIIYYLVFHLYIKLEDYNKNLTRVVREEALRNVKEIK